ncbi:MAG TPA: type II toxin-antitoxin system YafQ family toxin [Prolixibacteraceae bacterium]|nr:type II toxin-antitoxin system YafQ family toxin [Prolixibacteraceae bacterium]
MKYEISYTNRFRKDLKKCSKRKLDLSKIIHAIDLLQKYGKLSPEYKPHQLKGNYSGLWECHLMPDWLMVWSQDDKKLTLLFMFTGSHSDLF